MQNHKTNKNFESIKNIEGKNENINLNLNIEKDPYHWSQELLNEKIQKNTESNSFYKKIIIFLFAVIFILIILIGYLIQQPKKQPFIMVLNEKGQIEKKVDLEKNLTTSQMLAIEQYQVIDSIQNLLSINGYDPVLQKIRLEKGMNYILPNSQAEQSIKEFLNKEENNPYLLQKEQQALIQIKSIKQLKKNNENENININKISKKRYYEIRIEKQIFDLKQNLKEKKTYDIIIGCIYAKSKNENSIYKNPLGIFISHFEMTPIIEISNNQT